ncbi:PEP-utilizing enzyme [Micromonospora sp. NBC_01699]|uniref:PEP/pyruvate-binding domain-containing protein n=1 Tax=Micromonospora sp. NBC_01699 TaxID=2975984 RepID=UPI002E31EC48|nr:PEP/pyruvate-binding domain-containing protein [Micromonospora sp. NBC_01699]
MWVVEDGPDLVDPEKVGNKFAKQVVLARAGFPVPPLVCVPASVFDHVVGTTLADPAVAGTAVAGTASTPDLIGRAEELRHRVRAGGAPPELRRALADRFDQLAGPDGLLAVRACVVPSAGQADTGEDSADDPFAGLSDSFLYIGRDDLTERVVDCWASGFNPEAVAYRARRGLPPFAARVAVGIQRMAMGTRSFVAFTRDPRDGSARCVVAAAYGIGEGVVQEKADVDHFFVDRASGVIEAHTGVKSRAVGWDPTRPGDGPVAVPVDERLAGLPVLTDDQVREVTALALRVEERFGAAQDIEGTFTEDGTIHLVQARPVVTAGRATRGRPETAGGPPIVWDNNNVTESFPGVSGALTYSVARELYEVGFTDLYRRMGVPARTLRRNAPLLARMVGHLDGRIYYQLDAWYHLHGQMRCFRPLWSTWEQSLGLAERADPDRRPPSRLAGFFHVAEIVARLAVHPWRVRRFLRWWDGYHPSLADAASMRPHEAVQAYRTLWTHVGRQWGVTLVNGVFLFTAAWATNTLFRRWLPNADRSLLNGMLVGGPDNRSAQALHSVVALAATAAATPQLRATVLADPDPEELWERLTGGDQARDQSGDDRTARFGAALREHVQTYGDRGLHDLKIEATTPRDQPWTVLHTVRAFLEQGLTVEASRAVGRETRQQAERDLREHCRNPVKRAVLGGLFGALRVLMRFREDTRFCRTQLFGDTRALLLRLGAELAATGRLDRPRDVLDLTVEEVLGAFDGTLPGADLRALAAVRAAERVRWEAAEPLPARVTTDSDLPLAVALSRLRETIEVTGARLAAQGGDAAAGRVAGEPIVLTGLASSSGTVRGRAKVVLDPSVTADACRDRILVARETDPGWLYLMMSAKALVVERGTMLSHTAITGRLLGIPTVVAVPDATALITDDTLLEVDGAAGTVRILDGES